MDQLLAMRVFRSIVDAKGFSAAAERLGTSHSTISRQLKQLEATLGVQLINRNTRRFALTAAGARYFAASVELNGRLTFDAITALYSAALAGAGIAAFTRHTVQTDMARGHLVHLLPGYSLGTRHYYALYPQTRHVAPKVRAFVDHMAEHYRER